jgi:hypothetical protein
VVKRVVSGGAIFALLVVAAWGMAPAQAQTPTPTPVPCQGSMVFSNPTGSVTFNAAPQVVRSVCVQFATTTSGNVGNGTISGGCYTVSGVGTTSATVTRVNTAASCQAVNIFAVVGAATPTPTATATATATPTRTATPTATAVATATPVRTATAAPTAAATAAPGAVVTATPTAAAKTAPAAPKTGNAGLLGGESAAMVTLALLLLTAGVIVGARTMVVRAKEH